MLWEASTKPGSNHMAAGCPNFLRKWEKIIWPEKKISSRIEYLSSRLCPKEEMKYTSSPKNRKWKVWSWKRQSIYPRGDEECDMDPSTWVISFWDYAQFFHTSIQWRKVWRRLSRRQRPWVKQFPGLPKVEWTHLPKAGPCTTSLCSLLSSCLSVTDSPSRGLFYHHCQCCSWGHSLTRVLHASRCSKVALMNVWAIASDSFHLLAQINSYKIFYRFGLFCQHF